MSKIKDGGAAFPIPNDERPGSYPAEPGMSLRDWFAGQVLASAGALPMGGRDCQHRAKLAYAQADAMLAARSGESA